MGDFLVCPFTTSPCDRFSVYFRFPNDEAVVLLLLVRFCMTGCSSFCYKRRFVDSEKVPSQALCVDQRMSAMAMSVVQVSMDVWAFLVPLRMTISTNVTPVLSTIFSTPSCFRSATFFFLIFIGFFPIFSCLVFFFDFLSFFFVCYWFRIFLITDTDFQSSGTIF